MLVQRILDFIRSIEEADEPILCDVSLCDHLSLYFSKRSPDDNLNKEDIQVLLDCYKSRWDLIIDSDNDYTLNPSSVNQRWIDFARELEPIAKRSYLKILIPTVTNEIDLNDFSPLTETVNLFNFYLGFGGSTLYRKLSFCRHLERWQFVLSTYRNVTDRTLSVVTIDELARLKLCKQTTKKVAIDTEIFDNFWDLMRKKVFIHLSDNGQIPIGLLPHLLELVERYYFLKSNGLDFSVFKKDVKNFFRRLYDYELAAVNSLYGAKIEYKKEEQYLLDVFIDLHTATNFSEMELAIQALSKWLFHFDPELKASSIELESVYEALSKNERQIVVTNNSQSKDLENCCTLLVSLLTTKFKVSTSFTKKSYSLWDKSNEILPELEDIFTILLPLITENRPDSLAQAYRDIIKDIIAPVSADKSWYTWATRSEETVKWLDLVKNRKLNELGAYWFEPELLFSALLLFNTNHQSLKARINLFLDDIVQTYAQDQNDLMKQFRVNILFNEFLMGLSEHHQVNLLRLIKLCDLKTAKSNFLNNCASYINDRLSQLSQLPTETRTVSFFSQLYKLDSAKLFKLPEEKKDVSSMITEYKTQLLSLNLEPKISEKIGKYLLKIGQPILTVAQKEMAKSGSRPMDYMGQYT
ncbi:hypothetical protein [Legionella cincinnatiensis]|uniref:Uncharacterized protein n=1 Tax=Legionella cincinnatiensis TaxID=28085 RepID=A0A378IG84_9GAMM|nr:hypothetical protein [Legionella cincinnatiensis]KTC91966.1 hypothetical protein Lcin_0745 [Legionella cincinnatiensis]STX33732.1 Uncharacterised protein [Legionella cincinnatiensis]